MLYAGTDNNGDYSFTNVTMGYQNTPRTAYISATATGYNAIQTSDYIADCPVQGAETGQPGGPIDAGTMAFPPNNYGELAGFVYDSTTGLPIPYASVYD